MSAGRSRHPARLPDVVRGDGLVLRRWRVADAADQDRLVRASLEHLRPWMPFVREEPVSLHERRAMIAGWEREWEAGGDVYLAIHAGSALVGSAGLHRRIGPGGVEIGYWLHPAFVGRGHATATARLLTGAAFAVAGIDRVEIRNDRANRASGAVPARLGFALAAEEPNPDPAPADEGVDQVWRMTAESWRRRVGG